MTEPSLKLSDKAELVKIPPSSPNRGKRRKKRNPKYGDQFTTTRTIRATPDTINWIVNNRPHIEDYVHDVMDFSSFVEAIRPEGE